MSDLPVRNIIRSPPSPDAVNVRKSLILRYFATNSVRLAWRDGSSVANLHTARRPARPARVLRVLTVLRVQCWSASGAKGAGARRASGADTRAGLQQLSTGTTQPLHCQRSSTGTVSTPAPHLTHHTPATHLAPLAPQHPEHVSVLYTIASTVRRASSN